MDHVAWSFERAKTRWALVAPETKSK